MRCCDGTSALGRGGGVENAWIRVRVGVDAW